MYSPSVWPACIHRAFNFRSAQVERPAYSQVVWELRVKLSEVVDFFLLCHFFKMLAPGRKWILGYWLTLIAWAFSRKVRVYQNGADFSGSIGI